jgi:hypothetical protein
VRLAGEGNLPAFLRFPAPMRLGGLAGEGSVCARSPRTHRCVWQRKRLILFMWQRLGLRVSALEVNCVPG